MKNLLLILSAMLLMASCSKEPINDQSKTVSSIETLGLSEYLPDTLLFQAPERFAFVHTQSVADAIVVNYYLDKMTIYSHNAVDCQHQSNHPEQFTIEFKPNGFDLIDDKGNIAQYR